MTTTKPGSADGASAKPPHRIRRRRGRRRGTSGCYAAATLAREGYDVVVVERKDESEAGHIACGDALKGSQQLPRRHPEIADRGRLYQHRRRPRSFRDSTGGHRPRNSRSWRTGGHRPLGVRPPSSSRAPRRRASSSTTTPSSRTSSRTTGPSLACRPSAKATRSPTRPTSSSTPPGRSPSSRTRSTSTARRSTRTSPTAVLLGLPRNRRDRGAGAVGRRARVQAHRPRRGLPLVLPAHGHGDKRRPRLPDERGADGTRRRPQRGS